MLRREAGARNPARQATTRPRAAEGVGSPRSHLSERAGEFLTCSLAGGFHSSEVLTTICSHRRSAPGVISRFRPRKTRSRYDSASAIHAIFGALQRFAENVNPRREKVSGIRHQIYL